ncbi:hypothetical protein Pyn_17934 [Prunus yedoensis var. nudiflora]|uniref:Uncharacterized protein n=1 Tax=Prunus yedoensis var. nudiflora TaxID=2094558 RepID=A0A314ZTZ6_PRUYE|nr:hypothetical protein Pyn_17934 [Prunus yedoensis var. nudiflora]
MNNKLVHAEIPDEPHVPFDRAVQIARRIQGGCIAISLQEAVSHIADVTFGEIEARWRLGNRIEALSCDNKI